MESGSSIKSTASSDSDHEVEQDRQVFRRERGRGRPVRRARGRGRGRGRNERGAIASTDGGLERVEESQLQLKARIDNLTEQEAKEILQKTAEKHPGVLFDILDKVSGPRGYHPPPGVEPPSWCICGRCREMPTDEEKFCCGRIFCISELPDFAVLILNDAVLALARLYRREVLVLPDEKDLRKANRHCAYRQFVLWHHGRLGAGIRRVIPSCCVWKIRDKFPDPFGQYTGYIPSRYN